MPFQQEMITSGRKAVALELDVRDEASITQMAEQAQAAFGAIDILVNNAGCNVRRPALEVSWQDWNQVLDTNLRGSFFVAKAIAPQMICAWVWPCHQHWLGNQRLRLRWTPRALYRKPRRHIAS